MLLKGNTASIANKPVSIMDQRKFQEDKMLIEQDPFLLEEQRYLSRMQKSHIDGEKKYHMHYENFHAPEMNKKKQMELYEN